MRSCFCTLCQEQRLQGQGAGSHSSAQTFGPPCLINIQPPLVLEALFK